MKKIQKMLESLTKLKLLINSLVRGKCCISFGVNTTADNGRRRTPMFCCSGWLMTRKGHALFSGFWSWIKHRMCLRKLGYSVLKLGLYHV